MKDSYYSESAICIYSVAMRKAIGLLKKPYWAIDPVKDIDVVKEYLRHTTLTPITKGEYFKGLNKFADFIRLSCHKPPRRKGIDWEYYTGILSPALQADIRGYIHVCQRNWQREEVEFQSAKALAKLTQPLRWMVARFPICDVCDLTPQAWYAYLDQRVLAGISPRCLNSELSSLKQFVQYVETNERPICERFLLVDYLKEGDNLPKDISLEHLLLLQRAIQAQQMTGNSGVRRLGKMDLAWFLLMLHSGLRTGEVRRLKLEDIEWEARRVRIRQSKGLKDRLVCLSGVTIDAIKAYLEVRGPSEALPENVFIFRHASLSASYCYERLETYGRVSGCRASPHQLRHSCATLLLNAGAPILSVQMILGHRRVDTTLGYARLYDGTVAADYYSAMTRVEWQLTLPEKLPQEAPCMGQLMALVDALHRSTLSPVQLEIARALREGLALMVEKEEVKAA
jgi:site-specific recombinase XerD